MRNAKKLEKIGKKLNRYTTVNRSCAVSLLGPVMGCPHPVMPDGFNLGRMSTLPGRHLCEYVRTLDTSKAVLFVGGTAESKILRRCAVQNTPLTDEF